LRRISWREAPACYSKSNQWEIWSSFFTTITLYITLLAPWIIILTSLLPSINCWILNWCHSNQGHEVLAGKKKRSVL
jgi:hypothetical protein